MPLPKGKTNNREGRPKGVPNKVTKPLRELISAFIKDNWGKVQKDFEKLEPKDRLQFFEKLMKYALPTLQAVNVTTDIEKQLELLNNNQLEELMNKILDYKTNL